MTQDKRTMLCIWWSPSIDGKVIKHVISIRQRLWFELTLEFLFRATLRSNAISNLPERREICLQRWSISLSQIQFATLSRKIFDLQQNLLGSEIVFIYKSNCALTNYFKGQFTRFYFITNTLDVTM